MSWSRRRWAVAAAALVVAATGVGVGWWWYQGRTAPRAPSVTTEPPRVRPRRSAQAQLRLDSEPPGAAIILDGEPTDRLTPDFFVLEAGREHRVRLELEGYEPTEETVTLEPGEVREIGERLVPVPPPL